MHSVSYLNIIIAISKRTVWLFTNLSDPTCEESYRLCSKPRSHRIFDFIITGKSLSAQSFISGPNTWHPKEFGLEYIGERGGGVCVAEGQISSLRLFQLYLPRNEGASYRGQKEPPWTANLCDCPINIRYFNLFWPKSRSQLAVLQQCNLKAVLPTTKQICIQTQH